MQLKIKDHAINISGIYDTIQCRPERYVEKPCAERFKFAQNQKYYVCELSICTGAYDRHTGCIIISENVGLSVSCREYNALDHLISINSAGKTMSCHEMTEDDLRSIIDRLFKEILTKTEVNA